MQSLGDPANRYWRTDMKASGRQIYMCLSNDPTVASDSDPLLGVLESSGLAQEVVNTHNDALAKYGRRYRTALAAPAEPERRITSPTELVIDLPPEERRGLLELVRWWRNGQHVLGLGAPTVRALTSLYRAIGGDDV
jgi:hypothetical protein